MIISLSLVLIVALGAVSAFAKYIMKSGKQSELVSDNFYFTSDYLKADETPTYMLIRMLALVVLMKFMLALRIQLLFLQLTMSLHPELKTQQV